MKNKPVIIVTGTNGQLGGAIRQLAVSFPGYDFLFTDRSTFDLQRPEQLSTFLNEHPPNIIINCAAYTAVDKAETDKETVAVINGKSVEVMAEWAEDNHALLIQISTDYVFNGNAHEPYKTDDDTDPVNYYGYTKWLGEQAALKCSKAIIIRTSWVYSAQGKNFVNTMLRLMNERSEISVVNDQLGAPTYAADLAEAIFQIVDANMAGHHHYGIFHYSNQAHITWYEFAKAIKELSHKSCTIHPITTAEFPTPAKRPAYSVLETSRIQKDYDIKIVDWKTSLKTCLAKIQS